ncbi:polyphosphate polymerase domain-containing protein [Treponema sp.]|uniref:polyphosphate polymerase domain-containing protein n=1 Tax=Treponema sp. TaxID=166 RepID=UPI00388DA8F0
MAIEVFNRREIKYMLNDDDKKALLSIINDYMDSDPFNKDGKTYSISNLYLDTESDELIRKSLEKPAFKEKIRLRSYGQAALTDKVFLESKKKYDGVVNKRRTNFILQDVYRYFETGEIPENPVTAEGKPLKMNMQVMREIDYIMHFYKLKPKVFISYDRWAFFEKNNSDFRLTIDTNIQTRRTDLRLDSPAYGNQLLKEGQWLMEAKAFKAFPLWFVHFLSERKLFKTSFSKYGTEYAVYKS